MVKKIGFIGLGKMGGGMAINLIKHGYPLIVYDIKDEAVNPIIALGANKGDDPKEVAEKSNIVITSLPSPREVEDVYLGENGVFDGAYDGLIAVDVSTIDPFTTIKIAMKLETKGTRMIDAPVSGNPQMAKEGTLVFFVSGDRSAFRECEDVLRVMGKTVNYIGEKVGMGHTVKLINNMMSMGNVLVASEAFALGVKMGVDPDLLYEVLCSGRGSSIHFVERFRERVLKENFTPGFTLDYARKDLTLALKMAETLKVPLPLNSFVLQLYTIACSKGLGNEDFAAIIKLFEEWMNVKTKSKSLITGDPSR